MTFLSTLLCRDASAVSCYNSSTVVDRSAPHEKKEAAHEPLGDDELLKIMVGDDDDLVSETGSETDALEEDKLFLDRRIETVEEETSSSSTDRASEASSEDDAKDDAEAEGVDAEVPSSQDIDGDETSHTSEGKKEEEIEEEIEEENKEEIEAEQKPQESQATADNITEEEKPQALLSTPPPVATPADKREERAISGPPRVKRTAYDLSQLLGEELIVNNEEGEPVDTNKALAGRAVIAVYVGSGMNKDCVAMFDAGYDAMSLAVVYCWVSTTDDDACSTGFNGMPARWYMSEDYEMLLEKCPNANENDEVVIVMDPWSGKVLCENALPGLLSLDPSSASYDSEAEALMQSWIGGLPMKQATVGHMQIPLPR